MSICITEVCTILLHRSGVATSVILSFHVFCFKNVFFYFLHHSFQVSHHLYSLRPFQIYFSRNDEKFIFYNSSHQHHESLCISFRSRILLFAAVVSIHTRKMEPTTRFPARERGIINRPTVPVPGRQRLGGRYRFPSNYARTLLSPS